MNDLCKLLVTIMVVTFAVVGVIGTIIHLNHPEYKERAKFAQEVSFSELLSLQNDLADEKIFIFFRFMVLDTLVLPEAIILVQGLDSTQLDIITQKQAEYQSILFGLRLRL